jgi:hypothetical protein
LYQNHHHHHHEFPIISFVLNKIFFFFVHQGTGRSSGFDSDGKQLTVAQAHKKHGMSLIQKHADHFTHHQEQLGIGNVEALVESDNFRSMPTIFNTTSRRVMYTFLVMYTLFYGAFSLKPEHFEIRISLLNSITA